MFHALLLCAWTVAHLYVFWRVGSVPGVTRVLPRRFLFPAGAVSWASYFVPREFDGGLPRAIGSLLELLVMDWMATLLLVALALLAAEMITGFGLLFRRRAPVIRGCALAAGALLSAVAVVQGVRSPEVTEYVVRLPGLPPELDGTVLVALSDLHVGSLLGAGWLSARVDQVAALRPDVVVLLGDLFEGHGRPEGDPSRELRRLRARLGVWAVPGNHESHRGEGAGTGPLEQLGLQVLRDRWREVAPGLVLAGVEEAASAEERRGQVGIALGGRPPGAAVLLAHRPLGAEAASSAGAGLMLAGHTHGGQVWPFGYLVNLFNSLPAGRHQVAQLPVIVSRGAGTWGPRMRLWRPGEILRVTLRADWPTTGRERHRRPTGTLRGAGLYRVALSWRGHRAAGNRHRKAPTGESQPCPAYGQDVGGC